MDTDRAKNAIYVFENYGLLNGKQESGDGYGDFISGLLDDDSAAARNDKKPTAFAGAT